MGAAGRDIEAVVREVVRRLSEETGEASDASVAQAVADAHAAFEQLNEMGLERRYALVDAMRAAAKAGVKEFATAAVAETGYGRAEDKIKKNLLAALKTPGPEILESKTRSGDHGLTLMERAPHGVIASIIPSTNPTATVINNAISMVSGGNAVVFNAHPGARKCSNACIEAMNAASVAAGGPAHLVTYVPRPSVETAKALMKHPGIALVCVTGGPGVVRVAMASGKKVVAAGPGNPPTVVDETADLPKAARDIVDGASFDNNIICTDEKVVVAVSSVADELKRLMCAHGAFEVKGQDIERLCAFIFKSRDGREGIINPECVGKDAACILSKVDIEAPGATRLALCEVEPKHPLAWTEQLMPVLPLVRVGHVDEAIDLAIRYEGGRRHTAGMHSKNIEKLSIMARRVNCSIFVKNGPHYAGLGMGGEGHTSFTIASPTGEGLTTALDFTRERRCTLVDYFRIV